MLPTRARNIGRLRSTMLWLSTTMEPEKTPAQPQPATARPTMNIWLLVATPQSRLPSSKRKRAKRKDQRMLKCVKTRPNVGWKAHDVYSNTMSGTMHRWISCPAGIAGSGQGGKGRTRR